MGIRDYISSTANAVNENAIKPVKTFCSTSYSHGHAAVTMIGKTSYSYGSAAASKIASAIRVNAVEKVSQQLQDEDAQSKMRQFASNIATNAAGFVFREALKTLPGGGPIVEIVSRSLPDKKNLQNHKKEEAEALKSKLVDHEEKIKELQAVIHKMRKEQSNSKQVLNQAEVHELDDVELEFRKLEAYKNQAAAVRFLRTIHLHSDENKQPVDQLRTMLMKGLISNHILHDINSTKKCHESDA
ncbi:uncharacterized protein LOC8258232 isoform X1 [Ricinus communis]|uniref:uncharacterized protein LOC8258232 isoform X1 n=1 Tax=Ricinus communis TaxID=3988 RepID=UPI00201B33F4|nr:uncharacterized protein LOC8258232 isoform X1 [Ricinus communis]